MGYRAKKIESERRKRLIKIVLLCVLVFLFLGVCIFSFFVPVSEWKYRIKKPDIPARQEGEMRLHFLSVGQGEASIVELPDGKVMLIDGGTSEEESKKTVLRYLNALSIDTIDYLVVTHTDTDHCGALQTVVEQKTVLNAYLPGTYDSTDKAYAGFYTALAKTTCLRQKASRRVVVSANETPYTFAFLYPREMDVDVDSSVLWLDYMGASALFTGDAGMETETLLMRDDGELDLFSDYGVTLSKTEILSVGHHGSAYSSSREFLGYLGVKTAVISCGKDNVYGHPTAEVLARLKDVGATTYRTDTDGHILVTVAKDGTYTTETIATDE